MWFQREGIRAICHLVLHFVKNIAQVLAPKMAHDSVECSVWFGHCGCLCEPAPGWNLDHNVLKKRVSCSICREILFGSYVRCHGHVSILNMFSCSVVSNSLRPHGPQHSRPPCSSLSPGACSNSYPLSRWWHPTIVLCHPLLSLPSVFPSIRVFSNESALGK